MSNIIPPLLSNSPPPITESLDDEEDDEFSHFTSAVDLSYPCEGSLVLSLPPSPLHSPAKDHDTLDINSNANPNHNGKIDGFSYANDSYSAPIDKDYQDKRKHYDSPAVRDAKVGEIQAINSYKFDCVNSKHQPPDVSKILTNKNGTPTRIEAVETSNDSLTETNGQINTPVPEAEQKDTADSFGDVPSLVLPTLTDNIDEEVEVSGPDVHRPEVNLVAKEHRLDSTVAKVSVVEVDVIDESISKRNHPEKIPDIGDDQFDDFSCYSSSNVTSESTPDLYVDKHQQNLNSSPLDKGICVENCVGNDSEQVNAEDETKFSTSMHDYTWNETLEDPDWCTVNLANSSCGTNTKEAKAGHNFDTESATTNDDFADFASFQREDDDAVVENETIDDDDGDFGDFDDHTRNEAMPNFADFECATTDTISTCVDGETVFDNAEKIIVDMFPTCQEHRCAEAKLEGLILNSVFVEIKDVTETNALSYQWMKSASQDCLLKALNIDTRNILYGAGWNPSMPKFAANLSFTPLEPVKSDILMPTPVLNPSQLNQSSPTPSTAQPDIPSAQFDWNGSGLTNPLDSVHKDSKENLAPEDGFVLPTQQTPTHVFGDNDSVNSLQFTSQDVEDVKQTDSKPKDKDFGDFTSCQFHKNDVASWPADSIPLRESYISSRFGEQNGENIAPGWLKPTLLTPDSPRKLRVESEDDFSDFQMSFPAVGEQQVIEEPAQKLPPNILRPAKILEPLKPTVLQLQASVEPTKQINWPAPGITEEDIRHIELNYSGTTGNLQETESKSVLSSVRQNNRDKRGSISTSIETRTKSGNDDDDDEDWSDFICNPEPMKPFAVATGKTNFVLGLSQQQERSSTPELQLSVPQLSHLQPPKAPIPVITPNGLIQTKIPSRSFQPSITTAAVRHFQPNDHIQPSIISNQYQNHMNGPVFAKVPPSQQPTALSHLKNGFAPPPQHSSQSQNAIKRSSTTATVKNEDEDDWTDFISSPPVQNAGHLQNGQNFGCEWNRGPPQFSAWSEPLAPNIITNPAARLDSYSQGDPTGSRGGGKKVTTNVSLMQSRRSTIPSISALPDLDFVAPKSRTFVKKK